MAKKEIPWEIIENPLRKVTPTQFPTKLLNSVSKTILVASPKERKQLVIVTTIIDGKAKTKFDVRIINTHNYYDTLIEAILLYNLI